MAVREEIIGNVRMILGDCRDVIPTLGRLVDAVVTDPPYKTISGGTSSELATRWASSVLKNNDGKIFEHNEITPAEFFPLLYNCLPKSSHAYVMTNNLNLYEMLHVAKEVGFGFHNLLIWEKNNCTANRWYMKNTEQTLFLYKKPAKAINNKGSKQIFKCDNTRNKVHPTEKPWELMAHYIENSTQAGQVVLDPFVGSGATGVACVRTGRHFIGIEKDENYYEIACSRIRAQYQG